VGALGAEAGVVGAAVGGGEFTSSAPVATTAAEAALLESAEATGRAVCAALSVV
jgi:hypothetical protein